MSARRARLGSVTIGSRSPRRLAAWYRWALALPRHDGVLDAGAVDLRFCCRPTLTDTAAEPMRHVTNFLVNDIVALDDRLVAMETIWIRELERSPWGIIGTVLDPDGNYVQIIEAHIEAHKEPFG